MSQVVTAGHPQIDSHQLTGYMRKVNWVCVSGLPVSGDTEPAAHVRVTGEGHPEAAMTQAGYSASEGRE